MDRAVVTTNLLDLWAEPKFNSERLSQLLFSQTVTLGSSANGFHQVTLPDGYRGWADERFLSPVQEGKKATLGMYMVVAPMIEVMDVRTKKPRPPYLLYYGTVLSPTGIKSNFATIELDGKEKGLVTMKALRKISQPKGGRPAAAKHLTKEAFKFLGTPYLWGGVSFAGVDCSGYVQTLFRGISITLPRDTKDQVHHGKEIARNKAEAGDLMFFDRHVGMVIGRETIIHASRGSGGVRINGLKPATLAYRADLDNSFQVARRVL